MTDTPRRPSRFGKFVFIAITALLMIASGLGAFVGTLTFLMATGSKYHNNYEYYGQTPAAYLIFIAGVIGFLLPGVAAWHFARRGYRFSLRDLIIGITIIAVLSAIAGIVSRMPI
jgi:hypothetical protein